MIKVTSFGLSQEPYFRDLLKRISVLLPFQWNEIQIKRHPETRPSSPLLEEQKFLKSNSSFVLLDSKGKKLSDDEFYDFCFSKSERHFVVGPSFGFHSSFYEKMETSLSLSSLTLTHGLAQLVLAESLYRVACRLKNHPFVK
ncbi:MAG: 23S rRNA (pseudouridine(1915)-N(3))-methyltransferase RlmH [Bdellovibrionota bacterium]